MATATRNPAVVETRTVEVSPETVTLVLTPDEASAVRRALQFTNMHAERYNHPESYNEQPYRMDVIDALQGAGVAVHLLPWRPRA